MDTNEILLMRYGSNPLNAFILDCKCHEADRWREEGDWNLIPENILSGSELPPGIYSWSGRV